MPQANPYPLRVDRVLMEKFKVISAENGRSVNKELETLMKKAVKSYEQENGAIELPTLPESGE